MSISYNGSLAFSHLPVLKGTWKDQYHCGVYKIKVKQDNIYEIFAKISSETISHKTICRVKWDFPILDKAKLLKLLVKSPTSFAVYIKRENLSFEISVKCDVISQEAETVKRKLSRDIFSSDPQRLNPLADWFKEKKNKFEREKFLLNIITAPKDESPLSFVARSNAITILKTMGFSFSNLNFKHIDIRQANLSKAILLGTGFDQGDLRNVNLENAYMVNANFYKCALAGIHLGRKFFTNYRPIGISEAENHPISITLSNLLLVSADVYIYRWDAQTQKTLGDPIQCFAKGTVTSLDLSMDEKWLAAGSSEGKICIRKMDSLGKSKDFEICKGPIDKLKFSHYGDFLVSHSQDKARSFK